MFAQENQECGAYIRGGGGAYSINTVLPLEAFLYLNTEETEIATIEVRFTNKSVNFSILHNCRMCITC